MKSIGETLIDQLQEHDAEVVFGIPGVHTVELYRGLSSSNIRHITPRHEQGAGFMADGYARVSGKTGIAFVITGPGLTNILTPMGQARADSVPMLVVSSVNATYNLGLGLGHLHELPDQLKMAQTVALSSEQVTKAAELVPAVDNAYRILNTERGGPVHIEIPLDVMAHPFDHNPKEHTASSKPYTPIDQIKAAVDLLETAKSPVIIAGGGAKHSGDLITQLADSLDAPVVQTTNARGIMHKHPLGIPASPSLAAVRSLLKQADVVLGIGTEVGPTDFDMYQNGEFPKLSRFIRIDISSEQLARHDTTIGICGRVEDILPELLSMLPSELKSDGLNRASTTRDAAYAELTGDMREQIGCLETIRDAYPNAIVVGDSTQPIYAGNLYYDHDRAGGWFNAATGFGALGYGIPAAIGAAIADPKTQVICLTGDGGAQFTLPELMTAKDEKLPILFIVWNNNGYREIETSMIDAGVDVVGCDPNAPDFKHVAASCGISYQSCTLDDGTLETTLKSADMTNGPAMIEIKIA
ncbi:5-guanidino-2-oxopentanoate decarboxylase [Amylibacter sp. SFDW26]|uniref:5-guanidino-2-oxopentanoate decarboxylase n=1 Tax=Amylibacter sp. SFDW26 TaxID=2652722 RepID=UPI0012619D19|nr:5-guanidino-2-oxopentanoate decarboxylase [Amylibacter sp. SFDW26]KAB7614268.1 5-guanidino-2-oxopentanoate decarboxylase [Amylibacter sp. SFDW26]